MVSLSNPSRDHLVGLMAKASASGAEDPGFESRLHRDFSGSCQTSDLKIGTPVATLPGAWHYRVSAGTGRPGVSILWLGEVESLSCNFYLSVAARKLSVQIRPWDALACCWDVKQPTNQQTNKQRNKQTIPPQEQQAQDHAPLFHVGLFPGQVWSVTCKPVLFSLSCQAPSVTWSEQGLVRPVSVHCDWVKQQAGSAAATFVWHCFLCRSVPDRHYHVAGILSNQPTTTTPLAVCHCFIIHSEVKETDGSVLLVSLALLMTLDHHKSTYYHMVHIHARSLVTCFDVCLSSLYSILQPKNYLHFFCLWVYFRACMLCLLPRWPSG